MSLEQWEAYYQGGALATGPAGADGNYDQEVRQAWVEFFSTLSDGARILDVGTGNGVVALIASETAVARGLKWEIDATDFARIDPLRNVRDGARRLACIRFHPSVATEHLPFDDRSFDAVSGHYALEYTDTAAALAQIFRVLKPGGDAQFIVHHAESALLRSARGSMQEADLILKQTKIYRRLHRLVTLDEVTPEFAKRVSEELRAAIQVLKQALLQAAPLGGGHMLGVALDAVQKLLSARREQRPQLVGLEVDRAEEEIRAAWRRLNDLVQHARGDQDMELIQKQAAAVGFTLIELMPQYHAGHNLVGWQLLMHKP